MLIVLLCALVLFQIIRELLSGDCTALVELLTIIAGYGLFQLLELKLFARLRMRAKRKELFNAILWISFSVLAIANLIISVLSKNRFLHIIFEGLMFPILYFSVEYWDLWMDD